MGSNAGRFGDHAGASFVDYLRTTAPHLLPSGRPLGAAGSAALPLAPHGTTIVALTCTEGAVLAGDRRATSGNIIAQHDLEKVLLLDQTTAAGFAGSVGPALEMLKLFAVEIEQYEKIEGSPISFDGKVNRLSGLVRENLEHAMQGFVAVPILAGFDPTGGGARIATFDETGHVVEETRGYDAIGSGSPYAKSALKKRHSVDADLATTVRSAIGALYDAADDDSATGGPDLPRRIFPIVITITAADGAVRLPAEAVEAVAVDEVAARTQRPDG